MRTHMMVSLGLVLIMMGSFFGFKDALGVEHIVLAPSRVAAQAVNGIGFIGAGTILFMNKGRIRGLTTAAGLCTVDATVFSLIILWALQFLERKITKKFTQRILSIEAKSNADSKKILDQVDEEKIGFVSFSVDKTEPGLFIQVKLEIVEPEKLNNLIRSLQQNTDINKISWD